MSDYGNTPTYHLPDREKDPESAKSFAMNWARELDGETISTSTWDGDGLTVGADSTSGTSTTVLLSGGSTGNTYAVKNTITTSGDQTFAKRLNIKVREQ